MATLRVAPKAEVAPMKAAQISKPGAEFEIVERQIPEPEAGRCALKSTPVASAIVMCS
jgi:hypothetical protein